MHSCYFKKAAAFLKLKNLLKNKLISDRQLSKLHRQTDRQNTLLIPFRGTARKIDNKQ